MSTSDTALRRLFLVVMAGFLMGLALPPWGLWFSVIPAAAALYMGLRRAHYWREVARLGFVFGFVYYLLHSYWFASFHPLALPVALVYISVWYMLWALIVRYFEPNPWLFAAAWLGLEWVLGQGYLAFPWSRAATALAALPVLIQPVSFLGELLWGALWILTGFLLGQLLVERGSKLPAALVGFLIIGLLGLGGYRLIAADLQTFGSEVLLVQHNISSIPIRRGVFEEQYERLSEHTRKNSQAGDLIVWPETSIGASFVFDSDGSIQWPSEGWKNRLQDLIPEGGRLLAGTVFYDPRPDDLDLLNGAVLLEATGISSFYSKRIPVPLGEHLPMMGRWQWVYRLGRMLGTHGYRPGEKGGNVVLDFEEGSYEAAVQICFEDAFSSYVRSQVREGADLLVNLSNDSWSGSNASHRQHLYRARLRSAETGRMMLRSGNTGYSEIIDPYGRPVATLAAYQEGTVRGKLFEPLPDTLFVRYGRAIALTGFFLLVGAAVVLDSHN